MQYLYTLSSGQDDFYYEQFLLCAVSLKMAMPQAQIVLLCDSITAQTLTGKRTKHEKLVSQIIIVDAPADMRQIEVSRWVKTSMRRLVSGDFLYIDCDTIITDDLSSLTKQGIKFGACLDNHTFIDKHANRDRFIENDKRLGFTSYLSNKHFNSGVIYCVDTPETHKIFDRWHELWLFTRSKNTIRDQPSLNMAIYENSSSFTELDGIWNCQLISNYLPYIANAKIFHYFATNLIMNTSPFIPASEEIFKKIKDTGRIPDEVLKLLKTPKTAFKSETRIITGEDMINVIDSDFFKFTFILRKKAPGLFNLLNYICTAVKKMTKAHLVKKSRKKDGGIKYYN